MGLNQAPYKLAFWIPEHKGLSAFGIPIALIGLGARGDDRWCNGALLLLNYAFIRSGPRRGTHYLV